MGIFRFVLYLCAMGLLSPAASSQEAGITELNGELRFPWSVAELPDGGFLVAEREGTLQHLAADGSLLTEIQGVPPVYAKSQGAPFPGTEAQEGRPEAWTYGHRNPQGLVVTPEGAVWSHEHGPQGGDELNVLVAGENYGWPVATFGIDYNGARISPFERYPGMQDSAWHWTPSIGPSGLAYVPTPDAEAQGTFYLGGLAIPGLYAAERKGDQILAVERRYPELRERVRDVRLARDGTLLVLRDGENGRFLRLKL